MTLVCIKSRGTKYLTKDKSYKAVGTEGNRFIIIDDRGKYARITKTRFKRKPLDRIKYIKIASSLDRIINRLDQIAELI